MENLIYLLLFASLTSAVFGVDHDTFKNCSRTFCEHLRNAQGSLYQAFLLPDEGTPDQMVFNLVAENAPNLTLTIDTPSSFDWNWLYRIRIDEPANPRYKLQQVLTYEEPIVKSRTKKNVRIEQSDNQVRMFYEDEDEDEGVNIGVIAITHGPPFLIEVYREHNNDAVIPRLILDGRDFVWEEDTGNFAFNVTFTNSQALYGLFHHADSLALRDTTSDEPYRLRNSDTFEYDVNSTMALYGSIPAVYAHSPDWTGGLFLHNAAEQWIDVKNPSSVRYMVDAGAFDLFVLTGMTPTSTVRQFEYLTGVAHLPQLWTLGYHQCRWTYWTQEDIVDVIENMDEYDFPIDVVWLDDGYSNGNRYLVWNSENFTDPLALQEKVNETNRKLVVISDPHIKVDEDYFVYSQAKKLDLFVKYPNGSNYEGECWPGQSSYLDFLNEETTDFYANIYSYDNFVNSTGVIAGIWNDMNEPSVFDNSLEKTFPFDLVHYGGVEHKNVHNIYGLLQTRATHLGLLRRDNNTKRPFILTRSTFAGSQRYAAMWTGDNTATWDHLAVTYSECLTANILGQVWCGADVGAFHGVPDDELVFRWFQSAAWLPFYRAHSEARLDPEPPRQEPYAYPENIRNLIRAALRTRYSHIPQWYRLFYEHTRYGDPVIRPLFYHYRADEETYLIDQQLLLGSDILVRHVAEPNATSVGVYLPGTDQYWYRDNDNTLHLGGQWQNVEVDETFIPVYYRAGSIITRKDTPRPTTKDMEDDPYDLYVYLNQSQTAKGYLYYDDYTSFRYRDSDEYGYYLITYDGTTEKLSFSAVDSFAEPPGTAYIGTLTVYSFPENSMEYAKRKVFTTTVEGKYLKDINLSIEAKSNKQYTFKL